MIQYAVVGLGFLLGLSALGNWYQYDEIQDVREKLGQAATNEKNARDAANTCTAAVTQLQEDAEKRQLEAKPKIEAAKESEQDHGRRAQAILVQQPIDPNSACKSAAHLAREWLKGRAR